MLVSPVVAKSPGWALARSSGRSPSSMPARRRATVAALGDVQVLRLDREAVVARLETDEAFAARLDRAITIFLADRLRDTVVRLGYGEVERFHPG